ncbi:type I-F CRISPR-associated protein Csy1, partial [Yersinia kristensenii]
DILFNYVAEVQNLKIAAGWSQEDGCNLKLSQQIWLDPAFKQQRELGDWKKEVAQEFGYWLNRRLKHDELVFGEVERREWASLFKQRLREFEQGSLSEPESLEAES